MSVVTGRCNGTNLLLPLTSYYSMKVWHCSATPPSDYCVIQVVERAVIGLLAQFKDVYEDI